MAHIASRTLSPAGRSAVGPALFTRIAVAFAVWRQRRALAGLPDHLRRDVGLTDAEIDREARRHLWDVPDHWRF
ncbi:MAG: putative conserved small protein [Rhodobacteraceae bacterium HLUCCO18]|nr:MAG: putative conserved small protein [Rhodobacteraceae bacterium HLUCCO18]